MKEDDLRAATYRMSIVELIGREFTQCREVERKLKASQAVREYLLNDPRAAGGIEHHAQLTPTEALTNEGGLDEVPLGNLLYPLLATEPELRQMARDLLSSLNRVAIACLPNESAIYMVAMLEARYIAHVWNDWEHYIIKRRDKGLGRSRIFVPAEHLVHEVSKIMSKCELTAKQGYSDDQIRDDRRFWQNLKDRTHKISRYYPQIFKDGDSR